MSATVIDDDQERIATLYHVKETPTSYFLGLQGILPSAGIGLVTILFLKLVLTDPKRANETTRGKRERGVLPISNPPP